MLSKEALASAIEHTLLRPEAGPKDIERLCEEALRYRFAAVCVPPRWVSLAAERLRGSGILVATVVGFPLGFSRPEVKAEEARLAVRDGAGAVDMVISVGALKSGLLDEVRREIEMVVEAAKPAEVRVIIETGLLTPEEIATASKLAAEAGAAYVKTCTGFGPRGVTVDDVRLIRSALEELGVYGKVKIKAAGGIRTPEQAIALLDAGAHRLGTSAGVKIIESLGGR